MNPEERINPWPLNGYAPGNYMNKCQVCGTTMSGVDKLCFVCLECAASSANEINQSLYLKIQALEAENKELKAEIEKLKEERVKRERLGISLALQFVRSIIPVSGWKDQLKHVIGELEIFSANYGTDKSSYEEIHEILP